MQQYQNLIQQHFPVFVKQIANKQPNTLYKPVEYALSNSGKHIRPMLTLIAADMFKGDLGEVIKPAFGIELFHNFTLVHDDIMDNAPVRRGKPSLFKHYGATEGILAGDVMMMLAIDYLTAVRPEVLHTVMKVFNRTAMEICDGQQLDMDFEERNDVQEEEYIRMIELKTAVLLGAALQIGAIVADAGEQAQQLIYDFGRLSGISFQLQDDYLDTFGDSSLTGKQQGGDIKQNKKTYLVIKALEVANEAQRSRLLELMSSTDTSDTKVEQVVALFKEVGVDTLCKEKMNTYYRQSLEALDKVEAPEEKKRPLKLMAEQIVTREK